MSVEIWKPIKDYEGLYEISNHGNVRSSKKNILLKKLNNGNCYLVVNLSKNGRQQKHFIHRLVAEAFVDNPHNLNIVNHLDENRQNNNSENLEWTSLVANFKYGTAIERATAHAKNRYGKESYHHKKIICIETQEVFYGSGEIRRKYGINTGNISSCCNGKRKTAGGLHWKYAEKENAK